MNAVRVSLDYVCVRLNVSQPRFSTDKNKRRTPALPVLFFFRSVLGSDRYGRIGEERCKPQPVREETRSLKIRVDLINHPEAAGSSNTRRGASDTLTPPLVSVTWLSARAAGLLQPRSLPRLSRLYAVGPHLLLAAVLFWCLSGCRCVTPASGPCASPEQAVRLCAYSSAWTRAGPESSDWLCEIRAETAVWWVLTHTPMCYQEVLYA